MLKASFTDRSLYWDQAGVKKKADSLTSTWNIFIGICSERTQVQVVIYFLYNSNISYLLKLFWQHCKYGYYNFILIFWPADDDDNDDGDSADVVDGVVMRCLLINTKSLQEATLRFQPATPLTGHSNIGTLDLSASQDSIGKMHWTNACSFHSKANRISALFFFPHIWFLLAKIC